MQSIWYDLIELFITFITDFTFALNNVLDDYMDFNLNTFEIKLVLFSETPMLTINLYHLLTLIIFYILFKWFIKTLIDIVLLPIRYLRRFSNPREVVRK